MNRSPNPGNSNYCAICLNSFQDPRIVGGCLHSFCLQCLKGYIGHGRGTFLCPLCRHECAVPEQGVDALGVNVIDRPRPQGCEELSGTKETPARSVTVRQNPKRAEEEIASMTNQLKQQIITGGAPKGNEPPCSVCRNVGSFRFCKNCHDIYLCERCVEAHDSKPITKDHKLLGICSQHGKPAEFYCKNCTCAACSVCLIAVHSGDQHVVVSIFEIFTSYLDSLRGLEGDVSTTLAAVDGCQKTMGDINSRIKGQYTAKIAEKEAVTKKRTAEEQHELLRVQQDIISTRQKLKELEVQETKLQERQRITAQDAKADVTKYKVTMTSWTTKVARLIRELDNVKGKLSDGFRTSQGLLNITAITGDNINLLQITATGVRGLMMMANMKASAAEQTKQKLKPFVKAHYYFHHRHSDGLVLSEDGKVVSWLLRNPSQPAAYTEGMAWGGQQYQHTQMGYYGHQQYMGAWPMNQQSLGQYGVVMIQQQIARGDLVEIQIERTPTLGACGAQSNIFLAGFTHLKPESIDFSNVAWTQNIVGNHGYTYQPVGFADVNSHGLAMCNFSTVGDSGGMVTLQISRPDAGSAIIEVKGKSVYGQDQSMTHVYQPAHPQDVYLCLIFREDLVTKLTIVPEGK